MSSITYINLPSSFLEDNLWVYSLGVLGMVAYTRQLGHDAGFLDLAPLGNSCKDPVALQHEIAMAIAGTDTEWIGVSAVTPQYDLLRLIPQITDRKLVAGGIHASLFPRDVLDMGYNAVVVGAGERAVGRVLGDPGASGIYRSTEPVLLDALPFPDRSLVSGYRGPAPVMAGRGCPYRCTFCAQTERQYRRRTPADVALELAEIASEEVIFYDDTFTANRQWLADLACFLRGAGIHKRFRCSARSDKLTDAVAELLVGMGFDEVCLGVESGSQPILDALGKKCQVEDHTRAVQIAKAHGLRVKAFIMLGSPGESAATIQATDDWLAANRPDKVGLYILRPLPGSHIYEHPEQYDLQFDRDNFAGMFYGGRRGEIESRVSTSHLTRDQITAAYRRLLPWTI